MKKLRLVWLASGLLFVVWYIFCLPAVPFNRPYSTVLFDRNNELLGACVASDEQWRFPSGDSIPEKYKICLIEFEDRGFYDHPGVSAKSIFRAVSQNIRNGKTVSGASTITMQVARMMGKNKKRNLFNKIKEMLIATRLEIRYSKAEILNLYVSNAPYGNNVVGFEAASWRYYGNSTANLSWAQSATLAVLPNAPGLMYPGRNHDKLMAKRNRLLRRLYQQKILDGTTLELALSEPLPSKPLPLPELAPHLLHSLAKQQGYGKVFHTFIDKNLQEQLIRTAQKNSELLGRNYIENAAAIITSTHSGEVLAYLGNLPSAGLNEGKFVDCAQAKRSSGSILKPILFESAMEDGLITNQSLLFDVPSRFQGFNPKNFNKTHEGVVPANKALSKSLNIPFVLLLKDYGQARFCEHLKQLGLNSISRSSDHYGLSLILGGAEISLCEITGVYRNFGAEMQRAPATSLQFMKSGKPRISSVKMDRECLGLMLESMTELNRPDDEGNWKLFSTSKKIAWKTGTSFGFRDAWAVGVTPDYTIGVWAGNSSGEGRPGCTGVKAAAPFMFDLFSMLPQTQAWFQTVKGSQKINLCIHSGFPASTYCPETREENVPASFLKVEPCKFHKALTTSPDGKYLANSDCFSVSELKQDTFFILPPLAKKYFNHPGKGRSIPGLYSNCMKADLKNISLIYPTRQARIIIPRQFSGEAGELLFEAASTDPSGILYWHLDNEYIGSTTGIHQIPCLPDHGQHKLSITNQYGQTVDAEFEILN